MLALGLDIGYYATKGCSEQGHVSFPSLVGSPDERIFSLHEEAGIILEAPVRCRIPAPVRTPLRPRSNTPAVRNELPSPSAARAVVSQSLWQRRRQDREWWRASEWDALLAAGLSELVPPHAALYPEPAVLVLGLPVSWYLADKTELRERILGQHRFHRLGRDAQTVNAVDVRVLPQGVGVAMDLIFDDHGQVTDRALFDARIGIVDIGGNTVNLVDAAELRVGEASASRPIGCWRAVAALRRLLERELPGLDLPDHRLAAVLTEGVVTVDGAPIELRYQINTILDDMADAVAAEISQLWGSARHLDRILIAGGGAHLIGDRLTARYPQARAVDHPQLANARGYWRFARRIAAARADVSQRIDYTVTQPPPAEVPHA